MKSAFEAMGGTYHQQGDYILPDLEVPEEPRIGIWGERRRKYLREHQKALYTGMLLTGNLNTHLEEVDRSAARMFDWLVGQFKTTEDITEELKGRDQLAWVAAMNSIQRRATEIVNEELIYT